MPPIVKEMWAVNLFIDCVHPTTPPEQGQQLVKHIVGIPGGRGSCLHFTLWGFPSVINLSFSLTMPHFTQDLGESASPSSGGGARSRRDWAGRESRNSLSSTCRKGRGHGGRRRHKCSSPVDGPRPPFRRECRAPAPCPRTPGTWGRFSASALAGTHSRFPSWPPGPIWGSRGNPWTLAACSGTFYSWFCSELSLKTLCCHF